MIEINQQLSLAEDELTFSAGPSSGPGGQNVNKVSSRVTVRFDVASSPSLEEEQRQRILQRLSSRINKAGVLAVHSQKERSQAANRDAALERLVGLLREALQEAVPRRPTRVPRRAKQRRLQDKRRRSERKRLRARTQED